MKDLETIWRDNKDKFWLKKLPFLIILLIILIFVGFFGLSPKKTATTNLPKAGNVVQVKTATYTDFHLLIPSLNISAPIIADVDGNDQAAYDKALQGGVAQYKGTAKPGEGGNIFIFGHSSYYWWDPGQYKEIFKNLEDIRVGDDISIWYQKKEYKYKVASTEVVDPTDVSVLEPTKTEQLTLMTCVPPGTAEKRLIVIAKPM
jgi:sortase A